MAAFQRWRRQHSDSGGRVLMMDCCGGHCGDILFLWEYWAAFQMWRRCKGGKVSNGWHSDGGGGRFPMWAAAFRWWIVVVVNVAGILFFLGVLSVIFKVAAAEFR